MSVFSGEGVRVCLLMQDVFYLTVEELFAFVEGRSVTNNLGALVELRRAEYAGYRKVCHAPLLPRPSTALLSACMAV